MEIRVCPNCGKAFYAPRDGEQVLCLHCGFLLYDRRSTGRSQKEVGVFFYLRGIRHSATLKDYSTGGAGLEYGGKGLEVDTIVDIDIEELGVHMHAITVWSRKVSGSRYASGLKYLQT